MFLFVAGEPLDHMSIPRIVSTRYEPGPHRLARAGLIGLRVLYKGCGFRV